MPSRWHIDEDGVPSVWMDPDDSELFSIRFDYFGASNIGSYEVETDGVEIFSDAFEGKTISFYARSPKIPYGAATFQATSASDQNVKKSRTVRFYVREN
ncbi:MAG: hypothetical protein N0C84_05850 [Candidatus Thiodiazotropha taylori]|uniref:Uncharacterized protein n=1 Tax=Candidatus Thiodiazotropha taylori TaxID=2792791 RepID=A0A9E4KB19_9GAMM|nr:hypothetical protein [Candidatus Thiodiazotropha taylori]MCW4255977.1 hypothetical protein [Candidatus Thiodiazotropha taylori]